MFTHDHALDTPRRLAAGALVCQSHYGVFAWTKNEFELTGWYHLSLLDLPPRPGPLKIKSRYGCDISIFDVIIIYCAGNDDVGHDFESVQGGRWLTR